MPTLEDDRLFKLKSQNGRSVLEGQEAAFQSAKFHVDYVDLRWQHTGVHRGAVVTLNRALHVMRGNALTSIVSPGDPLTATMRKSADNSSPTITFSTSPFV